MGATGSNETLDPPSAAIGETLATVLFWWAIRLDHRAWFCPRSPL